MFYRVTADMLFTEKDEATDFFHDCQLACPKSIVINEGQPNQERGNAVLQQCFHDEVPSNPCIVVDSILCPPLPT